MTNIVGIDLGTTFSALAKLNEIGKPQIIPNADGERITPSAIYFDEENSDIIRVGIEAVNSRQINAERSVRWIKREIGNPDFSKCIDNKKWSAIELSALILKKLKQDCSAEQGEIKDAIISVPAHFDEVRRKATMDAGKMAGLNVIGIINEPVAAALYYATTQSVNGRVLVYDLGGGTFDVTLMDVKGGQINIICSQGDHKLGGVDFDKKILEIFEKEYYKKYKQKLITNEEEKARYEDEAEDVKKTLSRRPIAKKILYGQAGSLKVEITREMFEKAVKPLLDRTQMLLEMSLEEAKLKPQQIDKVLLVGGSTRIPAIQKRLTEMFGSEPQNSVNVDECVALGAAIHAGLTMIRKNPEKVHPAIAAGLADIKLQDVCNHSYGTICAPLDKETNKRVVENRIILKKNMPLPCESSKMFYTMVENQTELEAIITQGEDTDPDYINKIGTYKFKLPPDRPAKCPVKVTYGYDLNQRMHCKFEDLNSNKSYEVDYCIDSTGNLSKTDAEENANELETFCVK